MQDPDYQPAWDFHYPLCHNSLQSALYQLKHGRNELAIAHIEQAIKALSKIKL